jgi:hypothetical protein
MLAYAYLLPDNNHMIEKTELALLTGSIIKADDVGSIVNRILPRGHVIHGYSDAGNTRLMMILESREYSDTAPLLGFGMDGNAERALVRALATYVKREQLGLDHITEDQFPESTEGQIATGRHPSRFDNIVWGADFKMYQDGSEIVAASSYGGEDSTGPVEVRSSGALGAIVSLADTYEFNGFGSARIRELPAISLE